MQNESTNKVTIKSIAEELGISFSTVSKSLNHSHSIKEETRNLVIKKASEMGYSPNLLARGLRTKSTKTIAVIFNDIENPVLTYIFKTISVRMAQLGFTTLVSDAQFDIETERSTIESVISRMTDYVIIAPSNNDRRYLELLSESSCNVIIFDAENESKACSYIDVDYEYGGYIAASELLANGHREILIITEPLDYPYSLYYTRGIRKAFAEYLVEFKEENVKFVHSSMEQACAITLSLWDQKEHRFKIPFTAVMCFGDNFALGVYKAVRQVGLSVPEDISVIGFDNNEICEFTTPPLTSVHLPKERMASNCIEILEADLVDGKKIHKTFTLSPHLVTRQSVKKIY